MKKKVLSMAICTAMVAGMLAACGGGSSQGAAAPAATDSGAAAPAATANAGSGTRSLNRLTRGQQSPRPTQSRQAFR